MMRPAYLLLASISVPLLLAACGGRGEPELFSPGQIRQSSAQAGRAVSGYNPPSQYEKGIGLRAAADVGTLLISVDNQSDQAVLIGPDMFRLITPDGLYAFERGREDLSGFRIRTLQPGEHDVFVVRLPRLSTLSEYALVMNYPPAELIQRVFIEPVGSTSLEFELPPVREY